MGTNKIKYSWFPAKVLLFGEYAVLDGGNGLAIPFTKLKGRLSNTKNDNYQEVQDFLDFLISKKFDFLELRLLQNLKKELTGTDANIPIGYGVGSSGMITAAIYDFATSSDLAPINQLGKLKSQFSDMESHFHGASSGLDPLVSYTRKAISFGKDQLQTIDLNPQNILENFDFHLVDTGISRRTAPLVHEVKAKKTSDRFFSDQIENHHVTLQNQCLLEFLNDKPDAFAYALKELSTFQLSHLSFLIPPSFRKWWQEGHDTNNSYCKLCGAGGGGFILSISKKDVHSKAKNKTLINEWLVSN